MSGPQGNPTEDLVTRLREFDWYGPPRKGADELLNEAANEIEKLRKALQPFADAHHVTDRPLSADDQGYAFAFATSLRLHQTANLEGGWWAPGYDITSKAEEMPNGGYCECGAGFWVSDVYHYAATSDGMWHTRYLCK